MVILRNKEQFLLLKRANPPHPGKYLPVGGKLEPFEDPYAAAIRETFEETGLHLDHLSFCGILIESSPTPYNWQSSIYLSDIEYMTPPFCDEGQLEWVPFQKIPKIPTPETDWQIYQYAMIQKPFVFNAIYNEHLSLIKMTEEIEGTMVFSLNQ